MSEIIEKNVVLNPKFRGVYIHTLDDKGRVSFPQSFKEVLGEKKGVVITNYVSDGARCIEGYSEEGWANFEETLSKRSRFDPRLRQLENFFLSRSASCNLDSSGRISLPPHLRSYAGLEKEIVFTASTHGFRIWDKRVWDLVFQEAESALLEDPSLFIGLDQEQK